MCSNNQYVQDPEFYYTDRRPLFSRPQFVAVDKNDVGLVVYVDMCLDLHVDTCVDMRVDMHVDMCACRHACWPCM